MDARLFAQLTEINQSGMQLRGLYSLWSGAHGISYHEMLVLYTIRECGYCTQKQICESYLLPKQTIHNVISAMRRDGVLVQDETRSRGREKAFVLSDKGERYAADILKTLDAVESRALALVGKEKLQTLTELLLAFDEALDTALEEMR